MRPLLRALAISLLAAGTLSFVTVGDGLLVHTASVYRPLAETDKLKVKGSLPGLSLEGVGGVYFQLGSVSATIPIGAFRSFEGKYVFEQEGGSAGSVSKLVLDPATERFTAAGRELFLQDFANPLVLRLIVGASEHCSMLLFTEHAGRWRFEEATDPQLLCGLPEAPLASPAAIVVGSPTDVNFTIEIPESSGIDPVSLVLVEVDESLSAVGDVLCWPADDGDAEGGDAVSDDGVYSCRAELDESAPRTIRIAVQGSAGGYGVSSPVQVLRALTLPSEAEMEAELGAADAAAAVWEEVLARVGDPAAAAQQAIPAIAALEGVVAAGLTYEGSSIWLVLEHGIEATIPLDPLLFSKLDAAEAGAAAASAETLLGAAAGLRSFAASNTASAGLEATLPRNWISDHVIDELDLFSDDSEGSPDLEDVLKRSDCSDFLSLGFGYRDDEDKVHEFRRDLRRADGAFVIDSITNLSPRKEVQIFIPEKVTAAGVFVHTLELVTGELGLVWIPRKKEWWWAAQPNFILTLPGRFDRTLIFVNAPNSAYNDTLAEAFFRKGAEAYFGYDRLVHGKFAEQVLQDFFGHLTRRKEAGADPKTVAEAFAAVDPGIDPEFPHGQLRGQGNPNLVYHCPNFDWTAAKIVISTHNTVEWKYPDGSSEKITSNSFHDLSAEILGNGRFFEAHYDKRDGDTLTRIDIDFSFDESALGIEFLDAIWSSDDAAGTTSRTSLLAGKGPTSIPLATLSPRLYELKGAAVCESLERFEYKRKEPGPASQTFIPPAQCNAESRLRVWPSGGGD